MTEDMIDQLLMNDLMYFGIAFIKVTVDENGNIIRERINPYEIDKEIEESWK